MAHGVCVLCKCVCMGAADCLIADCFMHLSHKCGACCRMAHSDMLRLSASDRDALNALMKWAECSIRDWHWTGISATAMVAQNQ